MTIRERSDVEQRMYVRAATDLTPSAKLVMLAIMDHAASGYFHLGPEEEANMALQRTVIGLDLKATTKLVFLAVLDLADHGRTDCTEFNAAVATAAATTERHVVRALAQLEEAGWISVARSDSRTIRVTPKLKPTPYDSESNQ